MSASIFESLFFIITSLSSIELVDSAKSCFKREFSFFKLKYSADSVWTLDLHVLDGSIIESLETALLNLMTGDGVWEFDDLLESVWLTLELLV